MSKSALGAVVRGARVVGVHEIWDLPARGGGAGAAQIIGMHVGVDHRGGRGPELLEHLLVWLQVAARVDDDGVPVAHEHVG